MTLQGHFSSMKTYKHLWLALCSKDNLKRAYYKARRGKTNKPAIKNFDEHWQYHLAMLRHELLTKTYAPRRLKQFTLRDPKTRLISVSDFRDRVIHHALINILQPIFEPRFIHDSYASRKGKGTLAAVQRLERMCLIVSRNRTAIRNPYTNNNITGYAYKADIKRYFDTVDHDILLRILHKRVRDEDVLWIIRSILDNHRTKTAGKGMPLGNWTSQFFANVYLDELDQHIKQTLKAKHYIRYVDDFIILHHDKKTLERYAQEISVFLKQKLAVSLHPDKCAVIPLRSGIPFLGYRVFAHHKLLTKKNLRSIRKRLRTLTDGFYERRVEHEKVIATLQGWSGYAQHANTYHLRAEILIDTEQSMIRQARGIPPKIL